MKSGKQQLPPSVYWVFVAVVIANAVTTYIIIKYFM